ncbi:MAG: methionyl-tRNA formyltransferase [Burkholderiales bacterium RIFCSPLOWO2_12_67_14]|nr:MAG: methionyl-tRNA formyltransferase [Burkholderiales bacterium RIFCSPLOWO2_02_FULL_67_64]OGB42974.1 MAG: methionyl-tRNA formyltransferase [Burkholderiales bacterium RIFCSPHIGHO2_12_FULL_67_38]OGB48376.1 MAG: methionyl-tRNA formyltransferase [Burkholderiales bacterium RIFCSPLOWO2_12_67_14]OGC01301.1 MAG: methionyl-tRNA formyltransferase [Burkholderiales bacterium RIFCSPLOWO2_12_FULL_67_210]OGC01302.1 MAG: methionyl-tRNA formyltransferase [Burkholderiales bacterium RIFCSPLOWO2_12_FULL_67_210
MRIIFAGTPDFARVALERLHAAGFEIALVMTQPDRPAGRGMKLQASAVKQFALAHGMPVAQPRSLRLDGKYSEDAAAAREAIAAARADAMVVAAYGLILPQWVLDAMGPASASGPGLGCLNIHASLLPRWRGAAPIHRAIEAGDAATGVTIMQMDAGLDTGDMLLVERLPIGEAETTGDLHDRLAELGGRLIVEALELAACGGLRPVPQPAEGVSYAHKIEKTEASIDWSLSAAAIARRVRAFNPFPGASFALAGEPVKLWAAHAEAVPVPTVGVPGQVLAVGPEGIRVMTGEGVLVLTELQRAGGKRLGVADFLRGFALEAGQVLDGVAPQVVAG